MNAASTSHNPATQQPSNPAIQRSGDPAMQQPSDQAIRQYGIALSRHEWRPRDEATAPAVRT
jgi:hypothetical protein